jgi:hypothetical protein
MTRILCTFALLLVVAVSVIGQDQSQGHKLLPGEVLLQFTHNYGQSYYNVTFDKIGDGTDSGTDPERKLLQFRSSSFEPIKNALAASIYHISPRLLMLGSVGFNPELIKKRPLFYDLQFATELKGVSLVGEASYSLRISCRNAPVPNTGSTPQQGTFCGILPSELSGETQPIEFNEEARTYRFRFPVDSWGDMIVSISVPSYEVPYVGTLDMFPITATITTEIKSEARKTKSTRKPTIRQANSRLTRKN